MQNHCGSLRGTISVIDLLRARGCENCTAWFADFLKVWIYINVYEFLFLGFNKYTQKIILLKDDQHFGLHESGGKSWLLKYRKSKFDHIKLLLSFSKLCHRAINHCASLSNTRVFDQMNQFSEWSTKSSIFCSWMNQYFSLTVWLNDSIIHSVF